MPPVEFEKYKVKDLILSHMSGPSPTCEERQIASAEEWGLLKTTAVTWGGWDWTAHKVPPKCFWGKSNLEVQSGDVVVTKAGPRHRVGVVAYVDYTPPRIMVSGKMIGLRPDPEKVEYRILAGALSQFGPQRYLDNRTTGMADSQLNFTNELLLNTEVELPPFPEQTKIAEILSMVDRAIEQTEALIAKQQRIKTGLMQDLLTKGIDEHGNLRAEATHKFKDSPLGRIPVEWETETFEKTTPKDAPIGYGIVQPGQYDYTGIRVAGIYTINSEFQRWHMSSRTIEQAYSRSRIQPGDVLLSIKGTTGRVGVVPVGYTGNISRELARIRPADNINPYFLRFLMLSDFFQRYLDNAEVGTTRAEISIKILRQLFVLIPPENEQQEIVKRIELVEESIRNGEHELRKVKLLKTGLMQDLLTGRKRVTPLLEPATTD